MPKKPISATAAKKKTTKSTKTKEDNRKTTNMTTTNETTKRDTSVTKQKLRNDIERNVRLLVGERIKNHVQDFSVLYVRRNKLQVDGESMVKLLDVVGVAIDDAYLKFIDEFTSKIATSLETFEEDCSGDPANSPLSGTGKNESK